MHRWMRQRRVWAPGARSPASCAASLARVRTIMHPQRVRVRELRLSNQPVRSTRPSRLASMEEFLVICDPSCFPACIFHLHSTPSIDIAISRHLQSDTTTLGGAVQSILKTKHTFCSPVHINNPPPPPASPSPPSPRQFCPFEKSINCWLSNLRLSHGRFKL